MAMRRNAPRGFRAEWWNWTVWAAGVILVGMPLIARIIARKDIPGPDFLDVLDHLASKEGDLAVLHSGTDKGVSVLAAEPVCTLSAEPGISWRWHGEAIGAIEGGAPALGLLAAWQGYLDQVLLDNSSAELPASFPVGWLGFIGYDLARHLEDIGECAVDDLHWPLLHWSLFDAYYLFDHGSKLWTVATFEWSAARDEPAEDRLDRLERILWNVESGDAAPAVKSAIISSVARGVYTGRVQRVKDYLAAGDIYQANLAQRWTVQTDGRAEQIYRRLCSATAAEYAAFFRLGDRAVLSASPELFLRRDGLSLVTRPIKGTRRRVPTDREQDLALRDELLHSAKDQAELAMIVDLLRNDLGRICEFGSVQVVQPRAMEIHPTLWHTVAEIVGRLRPECANGWEKTIGALCPGGSITGAPKVRAMQIIEELEPVRRGLYCGNIGWLGAQHRGCLSIAIRTILLQQGLAYVYAGGGIVADSEPDGEYDETVHKAFALLKALGV